MLFKPVNNAIIEAADGKRLGAFAAPTQSNFMAVWRSFQTLEI